MKRGPKEIPIELLIWWEREWHWIFHGLAFGIPARPRVVVSLLPPPPPKRPSRTLYVETVRYGAEVRARQRRIMKGEWQKVMEEYKCEGRAAEPEVWEQIKRARTPDQIRKACDASRYWLNPSGLHTRCVVADLHAHASAFLLGKKYRCPNSDRPTSKEKLVVHFARVMAGITLRISPARAIDRLRALRKAK